MYRVFIHRHTGNLGDAIQTAALCRLLGPRCLGVYRDEPCAPAARGPLLIANGWLGHRSPEGLGEAVFAGVHLARHEAAFAAWMREAGGHSTVGARDPYTRTLLRGFQIKAATIGCATLTFDRYRGRRAGRYSVDGGPLPGATPLTNCIGPIEWDRQWALAVEQLDRLRRAEVVYTARLHAILPCLAFGTPVVFPSAWLGPVEEKQRLTLLGELPFAFDEPVVADISRMAGRYVRFLENAIGPVRPAKTAPMPLPLG